MAKVGIIGLDGGTFRIIDHLVGQGRLPNFSKILAGGARGTLLSSRPPLTPAAWTTFYTGTNAGKHGAVDFFRRQPGTYRLVPVNASTIRGTSIWEMAGGKGMRTCIYNVPVTYPAGKVNGVMISGMDAPRIDERAVFPESFRERLLKEFPDFIIEPAFDVSYLVRHSEDATGEHIRRINEYNEMQLRVIQRLMEMEDWDLFMAVIRSTDSFQHAFWREAERAMDEPEALTADETRRAEAVFSCYERIDCELGDNWFGWAADRNLIFMSDHGFGRLRGEVCINRILADAGLLRFKSKGYVQRVKESAVKNASALLPVSTRKKLRRLIGREQGFLYVDSLIADIDWENTRMYSLGQFGTLYLNKEGREPMGIVSPGREAQAAIDEAIEALGGFMDKAEGERVFTEFYRGEELYHGPLQQQMPDLLAVMRNHSYRGVPSTYAELAEESIIRRPYPDRKELTPTGCHRLDGLLAMYGPDIAKVDLGDVAMVDLAPTIANLLALPSSADFDGKILEAALTGGIRKTGVSEDDFSTGREQAAEDEVYSDEDEAEVRKRLQDLGYL